MTNMTLAVPQDLRRIMKRYAEVRWSEVARQALWKQARKMEIMDKILSQSTLTERDALAIGTKINLGIAKKHGLIK